MSDRKLNRQEGHRRVAEALSEGLEVRAAARRQGILGGIARVRTMNAVDGTDRASVRAGKAAVLGLCDAFEHLALAGADGDAAALELAAEIGALFGGSVASHGLAGAAEEDKIEALAAAFGEGAMRAAIKGRR